MDYSKLKGKIKEVYNTQESFGKALEMSSGSLSQRLNNKVDWETSEIVKACDLLDIPLDQAYLYFFTQKV